MAPVEEDHQAEQYSEETAASRTRLHGLVVAPAGDGLMTVLCGSVPVQARLPDAASAPAPILPGMWVNFEMDLSSGVNQIVCECAPRHKTYIMDDGSFSVLSPATYYIDATMDEEYDRVAYTPYFRFVDDPDGHLQDVDWMEWYEVLLTGSGCGAYLLKVERIVRGMAGCVEAHPLPDQLFRAIELEYRGHDPAVLKSYTQFLEQVCTNLSVTRGSVKVLPYVRWVQPLLRSKFVHKKYKLHYETRTHITRFTIHDVTGSTASTFLEYIERNIPEGVAMRVEYEELLPLPETITGSPYWKK